MNGRDGDTVAPPTETGASVGMQALASRALAEEAAVRVATAVLTAALAWRHALVKVCNRAEGHVHKADHPPFDWLRNGVISNHF